LSRMLTEDTPLVQGRAAEGLAALGSPAALEALVAQLSADRLTSARQAAMQSLEELGQAAVMPLGKALSSQDPTLRRNAAELLGWLAAPEVTGQLINLLADPSPQVRGQAAWSLGQIGTPSARQALERALSGENDTSTRRSIQEGLAEAPAQAESAGSPFPALLAAAAQVSPARWSFLALVIMLSGLMLVLMPRQAKVTMAGNR
jgi:HEAT repeat protein